MQKVLACLAVSLACSALAADPGLTATEIVIGQDIDTSGSIAVRMKPLIEAADAYIERVNEAGGVHGRKIRIVRTDSANKPDKSRENVKRLVERDQVFAMWGISGTGNVAAVLPYLAEKQVPLIGSTSGADSFYATTHPMLINIKAGYGDEIRRMVSHLKDTYAKNVAFLYMDNGFGRETLKSAQSAAAASGLTVVSTQSFKDDGSDTAKAIGEINKTNPQAILLLSLSGPAPRVVEEYAKSNARAQLLALSIIAPDALYKAVKDKSRGIIVTQVVPFPWDKAIPMVRDYQDLLAKKKVTEYSHSGVEGYLFARVLVEGLQAAGPRITRPGLLKAFEGIRNRDIGGYKLTYAADHHNGSDFVEITMIGREGRLVR
jgi:ABC-type branched-subunit amino acid transport system substrate-binding protein